MAQNRRAAARMQQPASSGQQRTRTRRRRQGGARRSKAEDRSMSTREQRGRVAGGLPAKTGGARRLLAEARDMAQSVGETTIGTARGIASGARDAAVGVANLTQGTAKQVAGKVRDNPWPAVLIGAGATWMVIDATRSEQKGGRRRQGGNRRSEPNVARRALSGVADAGRSVGGRLEQFVRDNPVLAGAATLGIGVAVGLALPSTGAENELLGDARDAMVRRAKDAARGTVRNVRDLAEGVGRVAGRS